MFELSENLSKHQHLGKYRRRHCKSRKCWIRGNYSKDTATSSHENTVLPDLSYIAGCLDDRIHIQAELVGSEVFVSEM